jgi:hypothetical protein
MAGYLASDAFAGPYLADRLLMPFALAGGGALTTVKPSRHSLTATSGAIRSDSNMRESGIGQSDRC